MSRRCSECRSRFEPAVTAVASQRVCGAGCRKRRRARQARRRRRDELVDCRSDERERQRQHRARARARAGPAGPRPVDVLPCGPCAFAAVTCSGNGSERCHELPSARKRRNLQVEMLEIMDSSLRLSRATFRRAIARMERELTRISALAPANSGQARRAKPALSLTGLSP